MAVLLCSGPDEAWKLLELRRKTFVDRDKYGRTMAASDHADAVEGE